MLKINTINGINLDQLKIPKIPKSCPSRNYAFQNHIQIGR